MLYFHYKTRLAIVCCFWAPLFIFVIGPLTIDKLSSLLSVQNLLIVSFIMVLVNFTHNYMLDNSATYRDKNKKGLPFCYYLPSLLPLSVYVMLFFIIADTHQISNLDSPIKVFSKNMVTEHRDDDKYTRLLAGDFDEISGKEKATIEYSDTIFNGSSKFIPIFDSEIPLASQVLSHISTQLQLLSLERNNQSLSEYQQQLLNDNIGVAINAIENDDWQAFKTLIANLSNEIDGMDSVALNTLLLNGAPFDVVSEYINRGAEVAPSTLLQLVGDSQIDYLNKLVNLGISIDNKNTSGTSLLDLSLISGVTPQAFEFLIDNSKHVAALKPELGIDTLGIAIANAETNAPYSSYYIERILNENASITEQHFQILAVLERKSPHAYEELTLLNGELLKGGT